MPLVPKRCHKPMIIMIIVGIVIVIGFFYYNSKYQEEILTKDPLNKVLFKIGPMSVSWWPVSHVILYFILGMLFPKCWLPIMILGILWEVTEYIAGLIFVNRRKIVTSKGVQYNDKWWSSNIFDPVFNALGFIIGVLARKATGF